jgi:FkbM family methyltransferase
MNLRTPQADLIKKKSSATPDPTLSVRSLSLGTKPTTKLDKLNNPLGIEETKPPGYPGRTRRGSMMARIEGARRNLRRTGELRRDHGTKYALRHSVGRVLWHSGVCRVLKIHTSRNVAMRFFPSAMSFALWANPEAFQDLHFLAGLADEGDTVVDVGANVGLFTLLSSRAVGHSGRVISFEPDPTTFRYLESNLQLNSMKNVQAHDVALSDVAGTGLLTQGTQDTMNRLITNESESGNAIPVRAITLDSLQLDGTVRTLKVDAEGFDLHVLRGAAKTLPNIVNIMVECSDRQLTSNGASSRALVELLLDSGFDVWRLSEQGNLMERVGNTYIGYGGNLLATRDQRLVGRLQ